MKFCFGVPGNRSHLDEMGLSLQLHLEDRRSFFRDGDSLVKFLVRNLPPEGFRPRGIKLHVVVELAILTQMSINVR